MSSRIVWPLTLLAGIGAGVIAVLAGCLGQEPHAADYRKFTPPRDREERRQTLGTAGDKPIDTSAFAGMPESYARAASDYVEAVCAAIKAEPLKRRRYYYRGIQLTEAIYDREVLIPLTLLPRPEAVKAWAASDEARSLGWRTEESVTTDRGSVFGRTVIYEPGTSSQVHVMTEPVHFGAHVDWDLGFTESQLMLGFKKLVVAPAYDTRGQFRDQAADLRLGEKNGARLLGEFMTVPSFLKNDRLRWTTIRQGAETRRFLAYALLDGNGCQRNLTAKDIANGKVSSKIRPLLCKSHQPRILQHDELLLPTPLGWPPTEKDKWEVELDDIPHEEWCLDDRFPAQSDACWVVREAEDSKPLQESFLLMPAREQSDRPVFFVALFAETEPRQLLKELAALYRASPDQALQSADTMTQLESLYRQLRNATIGKL